MEIYLLLPWREERSFLLIPGGADAGLIPRSVFYEKTAVRDDVMIQNYYRTSDKDIIVA